MPDHYNLATVDTNREYRGDSVQPKATQGKGLAGAIEQRGCSPEIPETLTVALDDIRTKEDDNIPAHICRVATRIACDGVSKNHSSEAPDRDISHSKHHVGSAEVGQRQQTDSLTWRPTVPRMLLPFCHRTSRRDLGSNNSFGLQLT
jgi:hypothetical protein